MDAVAERIKEIIDNEGLSYGDFARKINMNPSVISHILSGRNKPSLQLIESVTSVFTNVNIEYLINGKGSLYRGFTNVNKDNKAPDPAEPSSPGLPFPGAAFPMDGIRLASIPGSTPVSHGAMPEVPAEKEIPSSPSPEEAVENSGKAQGAKDIEQIVIFYTDGSFKAYRS